MNDHITEPRLLEHAAGRTLPPDLLAAASRRLGWAALLYSVTYALAYFGAHLARTLAGCTDCPGMLSQPVQLAAASSSVLLGLVVFGIARGGRLEPSRLLDLGLVFEVVGALGIAVGEIWGSVVLSNDRIFLGLSWTCVWIVIFPALAPSRPDKTLIAALAAASMPPLVLAISTLSGAGVWQGFSRFNLVLYFALSTYVCAGMAFFVSRIIYRFGEKIREARAVGSYRLLEKLGVGGMGEVWRAEHKLLAKPAAVKLIRPELLTGTRGDARRRFEREARATSRLRSVHTIELYDFGVADDGSFFYVMELLDGFNLERLVEEFGPQPEGRVIHLLRQVCRSLEEAHADGFVHRDIKPANIFVCRFGADVDFVKVLDFGLVTEGTAEGLEDADLTGQGVIAGTPAYAAPELMQGGEVDGRADLYSLGCVAYWLLTGTPVFTSSTPVSLIVDHAKELPEPPSRRLGRALAADLEAVLMKSLEKAPDRRYGSAAELDVALAECAAAPSWLRSHALAWWARHRPVRRTG